MGHQLGQSSTVYNELAAPKYGQMKTGKRKKGQKQTNIGVQNKGESISTSPKIYVSKMFLALEADRSKQMQYSMAQSLGVAGINNMVKQVRISLISMQATKFQMLSKALGQMLKFYLVKPNPQKYLSGTLLRVDTKYCYTDTNRR